MPTVRKLTCFGFVVCLSTLSFAALIYPSTSNFGVSFSKYEPWYQECMRVAQHAGIEKPAVEARGPQSAASALYYQKRSQGTTSRAEWNTVRQSALAHGDNGVLMMMYANGFGVPRNTDIATYYACSMNFAAKGETEARIAYLSSKPSPVRVFDQCDYITSGMMGGVCADIRQSGDRRMRETRLDHVAQSLPGNAQFAFKTLRAAANAYADAAWKEVDGHGSGAAGFAINHQEKLREQFMQSVLDLLGNKFDVDSKQDTVRLDAELNAAYRKLMSAPSSQADAPARLGESTIDRNEFREVERLWIAYRDAYLAFASTLPAPAANPIDALLINQRIADLNGIAGYL